MKLWQDKTLVTALKGVLEDYPYLEYDEAKSKDFSTGTTDVLSVKVTDLSAQEEASEEEASDLSELDFLEFVDKMMDLENQRAQRDDYTFELCKLLEKATSTWHRFAGHTVATAEGRYFNIQEIKEFRLFRHFNSVPIHEGGKSPWRIFCQICGNDFFTEHCYYLSYDPGDPEICGSCEREQEEEGLSQLAEDAARAYREEYGEPGPLDWSDVYDE